MYQETRPSTEEIVDIYADNIPPVEGTSLDCALPFRKQHFEVKKNDLFCSTLERPEIKEILEPENYNDVIDAIVLKPVIKAEDKKIDVDSTFELILERPMEPVSEEAKKVSFLSMEPEVLEVNEKGELNAQVNLGQAYVNCSWRSGVSKDLLVTIGEVSEIKPYQPGNSVVAPEEVLPGIPVTTIEEILAALEAGEEEIKLEADIETSDYIEIRDKKLVINLNGHVITHPANSGASYKDVFEVYGTGELTINGEGEVIAEDGYCIYSTGDSKVNLNGGYYSSPVSVVDARKNSSVTISGGEFFVDGSNNPDGDFGQKFTLNLRDKTDNYAGELSEIVVKGGKYYKFDPANNESNGAGTNYVAEGYESVQDGDWYIVSKKEE